MIMMVSAVVISVLVVLLLTRPLWQNLSRQSPSAPALMASRAAVNVEAYQSRLADLELALQEGRISADEKQDLQTELQRSVLADAGAADVTSTVTASQWALTAAVSLLLLILTAAGYWHFGAYQNAQAWQQTQQRLQPQIQQAIVNPEMLVELFKTETTRDVILSYQQQLLRSDANPSAWQALSRVLQSMEQDSLAQQAARKAYQQAPNDPSYALELAQLIIDNHQGKLTDESDHVLKKLKIDHPQDPRVWMLLGAAHLKAANWSEALTDFQKLQALLANVDMGEQGPLVQQKLAEYIAQAQQGLQQSVAAPEKNDVAANDVAAVSAVELKVQVSMDPASLASWKGSETLWVFAKVPNGPRFPVAAKKMRPTSWPVTVTLSDADAMMPQFKISGFPQVTITARLSENESVMGSQPGDWQQSLDNVDPHQTQPVELVLVAPKL
jgi:cytochrome c-type biogenesis protein CcmH